MSETAASALVLAVTALTGAVLLMPRLARAPLLRAAVTPLASIIGSGFLVLGPITVNAWGSAAPLAMAALCAFGWALGAAIRENIAGYDRRPPPAAVVRLERLAEALLAFAYVVSVAYYLGLFGAFAVALSGADDRFHARLVTTAALGFVALVGWRRGFGGLEALESFAVVFKLAVIAGLLAGFGWHAAGAAARGALSVSPPQLTGWPAATLLMG
ncbi:MAG: hypothetical protein D6832_04545, partial [Alphaproteobacteria bacterium]